MRQPVPLRKRPIDIPILAFFWLNIIAITYVINIESLIIADPSSFEYPLWPPRFVVDLVHWWGHNYDPVIIARPAWWKVAILFDVVVFGPFYVVAIYAYTQGKEWIRIPSIIYSSLMFTNVCIILGEEFYGAHAAPNAGLVFLVNVAWLILPVLIVYRMWRHPHPFTEDVPQGGA